MRPGVKAPELACVSWQRPGLGPRIADRHEGHTAFKSWLSMGDLLVGMNVSYDMGVMGANYPKLVPAIFEAYDQDRVTDVMLREKLLDIASGCYRAREVSPGKWERINYSLFDLTKKYTNRILDKDEWRLRYGEFLDVPLKDWPEGARTYPLEDARAHLDVYQAQEAHADPYLVDQYRQARKAFWLHLASAWGLRTVPEAVDRLRAETEAIRDECKAKLVAVGLVRPDGSRDTKAAAAHMTAVCQRLGIRIRLTDGGNVSLDDDACKATEDPVLKNYARYTTLGTILNKDVKALALGCVYPIHTHFDLAETGRTTSSAPNVQNWGKKGGTRECFTPRPGFVYAVGDVDQLELRTLAQVCINKLGYSRLAEALNSGLDPHTAFACSPQILNIPYEQGMALKDANDPDFDDVRQGCKFTNFALPGGVGPAKMKVIADTAGIDFSKNTGPAEFAAGYEYMERRLAAQKKPKLTPAEIAAKLAELTDRDFRALGKAVGLKKAWLAMWPEMSDYFAFVDSLQNVSTGYYDVVQLYTGRYRGRAQYPAACNTWFQGLGADGAGEAGWLIARAEYVDSASPLFGSRTVNHSHDDFVAETLDRPEAHEAAVELGRLMELGFGKYTPDVRMRVKPYLTRVWSKKAKAIYNAAGRLIPWSPAGSVSN